MSKDAFDKIADGLNEALALSREARSAPMVDKVARAICNEMQYDWDNPAVSQFRETYLRMAKAAIEAMREPMSEMVEIGTKARWQSAVRDADSVREIWTHMIGAALKEQEKVG